MKPTMKEIKENLSSFSTHSVKNGIFTVRKAFFYTHGKNAQDFVIRVKTAFPEAIIVDSGQVWKDFKGGASVANQSHWFVKFTFENKEN